MQITNTVPPPSVMLSANAVYAIQGNIYALEMSNGAIRRSYPIEGMAMPSSEDDVLYMNVSNHPSYVIQALRAQDGTPVWNYKVKERLSGAPVIANNVVYTSIAEGAVYAFRAGDGALLWQYKVNLGSQIPAYLGPILLTSPTVAYDVVFLSPAVNNPLQPCIYAIRAKNGTLLWRFPIPGSTSFPLITMNDVIYLSTDNSCGALRMSDGTLLWQQRIPGLLRSSPLTADSMVYVSFSQIESSILPETGEVKNRHDAFLCALKASDGSLLWQQQLGTASRTNNPTAPALAHDIIYVGTDDGYLHAISASNGSPLWSYKTNGLLLSSPVVANGMVFVGANDGQVYALHADNGAPIWQTFVGASTVAVSSIDIQPKRRG